MSQIVVLNPESIILDDEFNCRSSPVSPEAVAEMAESLKLHGQLNNVIVKKVTIDGKPAYTCVAGFTRVKAALLINESSDEKFRIRCTVQNLSDKDAFILNIAENLDRNELNSIDKATIASRLQKMNYTQAEIAKILRCTAAHISQLLSLLNLPEEIRNKLRTGDLRVSEALALVKVDEQTALEAVEAKENGTSIAETLESKGVKKPRTLAQLKKLCLEYPRTPLSDAILGWIQNAPNDLEQRIALMEPELSEV